MVIKSHEILKHPTHLFVGPALQLQMTVMTLLQTILCPQEGCAYCGVCQAIYTKSSARLLWLEPEDKYTRDMVQPIFEATALQRTEYDLFFIVIARAERLQQTSANALLKVLEEPPRGYSFLLMTTHERLILPTIASRCIVHRERGGDSGIKNEHQLVLHFTGVAVLNPATFLQLLENLDLSEQESIDLLDTILIRVHKCMHAKQTERTFTAAELHAVEKMYHDAMLLLPQSGSSKIFWKNLYLQTLPYYKTVF